MSGSMPQQSHAGGIEPDMTEEDGNVALKNLR